MNDTISIELLCMNHAKDLFELTNSNRTYLREWLPWLDSVRKIEDTQSFIASTIEQKQQFNYVIVYKGNICGISGFHEVDLQHKIGSIGYWLAEEYSGQGIMTKVVSKILEFGFGELQLNKIEIRCAEDNVKSRAIPERLGFINEATLRQCEWLYSKYINHVVYSLLASEYNA